VNILSRQVSLLPEILYILPLGKVYIVYINWRAGVSSSGECDMDGLGIVGFYHTNNGSAIKERSVILIKLSCQFARSRSDELNNLYQFTQSLRPHYLGFILPLTEKNTKQRNKNISKEYSEDGACD
jgi:hypothetical protein